MDERLKELKCGVWAIDTTTGQTIAFLEFEAGVEEIFDVQVLPGIRFPAVIGFEKDTIDSTFIVPPEDGRSGSPIRKEGGDDERPYHARGEEEG